MKKFSACLPKNVIHFIGAEPTIVIGQVVSLYQQRLLFPYITIKKKGFFQYLLQVQYTVVQLVFSTKGNLLQN